MYIKWYIWLVLFSQMKLEKRRITSIDSEIIQEVYLTVKKTTVEILTIEAIF